MNDNDNNDINDKNTDGLTFGGNIIIIYVSVWCIKLNDNDNYIKYQLTSCLNAQADPHYIYKFKWIYT